MKKTYQKPEMKKVNFSYEQTVVASGSTYCDQGWTKATVLDPQAACTKCYQELIWIGTTAPLNSTDILSLPSPF